MRASIKTGVHTSGKVTEVGNAAIGTPYLHERTLTGVSSATVHKLAASGLGAAKPECTVHTTVLSTHKYAASRTGLAT